MFRTPLCSVFSRCSTSTQTRCASNYGRSQTGGSQTPSGAGRSGGSQRSGRSQTDDVDPVEYVNAMPKRKSWWRWLQKKIPPPDPYTPREATLRPDSQYDRTNPEVFIKHRKTLEPARYTTEISQLEAAALSADISPPGERYVSRLVLSMKGSCYNTLRSYLIYTHFTAECLKIRTTMEPGKLVTGVYTVNRSPHLHGAHKDRFKRDVWNRKVLLHDISGTTADVYLGYVQRNIPAGVTMAVTEERLTDLDHRFLDTFYSSTNRKMTSETVEGLKMTSETEAEEGLKMTSETVEGLKMTSETVEGLKVTSETVEGLKVTSETVEGLKVTSETEEGLKMTSETEEGLKVTSETEEGPKMTSETEEGPKMTSETEEGLKVTSETDDTESHVQRSL